MNETNWKTTTVAILTAVATIAMVIKQALTSGNIDINTLMNVIFGLLATFGFYNAKDAK